MLFPKINHFPTYWENGMKLTANHFQHLENSIEDAVRDAQASVLLSNSGFGLLPSSPFTILNARGSKPQSVRVTLAACRAIMPGGYRVEIIPENIQRLQIPAQPPFVEFIPIPSARYHIYLTVDMDKKIPAGIPEARPIRHPNLCHDYQLEAIPQDKVTTAQTLGPNRMKIGEWQESKMVEGYIPPTLSIKGFPLLERWHQFFKDQSENIVRFAARVINEHRRRDPPRADFCNPIVNYIRGAKAYYKWQLPNESPIHLIVFFGNLAGIVEGLLETCDRDFVRNQLKNGQLHGLNTTIQELLKPATIQQEEMAISILAIQKFIASLISVLQQLLSNEGHKLRMGELNKFQ